jgi:hypothetical protein
MTKNKEVDNISWNIYKSYHFANIESYTALNMQPGDKKNNVILKRRAFLVFRRTVKNPNGYQGYFILSESQFKTWKLYENYTELKHLESYPKLTVHIQNLLILAKNEGREEMINAYKEIEESKITK